jgi:hypothetical protein
MADAEYGLPTQCSAEVVTVCRGLKCGWSAVIVGREGRDLHNRQAAWNDCIGY